MNYERLQDGLLNDNIEEEDFSDNDLELLKMEENRDSIVLNKHELDIIMRQSTILTLKSKSNNLLIKMIGRDPNNPHRASTPLELFFDLCFVVAVSQSATSLHHDLINGHFYHALTRYPMMFSAVWWPWMNVSFFASAYDTDDALYRLNILLICMGILVSAAGFSRSYEEDDHTIGAYGWTIMRIGLLLLFWRAWRNDKKRRLTCKIYGLGFLWCQIYWLILVMFVDDTFTLIMLSIPGIIQELSIPILAENVFTKIPIPWHAEHMAERFGLLALIVLGETLLTITSAIQTEIDAYEYNDNSELSMNKSLMVELVFGSLFICFSMWWLYFGQNTASGMENKISAYIIGYGHYFIYAAITATGSALAATADKLSTDCVDGDDHSSHRHMLLNENQDDMTYISEVTECGLSFDTTGLILAIPVSIFLLSLLFIFRSTKLQMKWEAFSILSSIPLIYISAYSHHAPLIIGFIMIFLVLIKVLYPYYFINK